LILNNAEVFGQFGRLTDLETVFGFEPASCGKGGKSKTSKFLSVFGAEPSSTA
jgi:hypothetical protein